jgi:hypothetical protein
LFLIVASGISDITYQMLKILRIASNADPAMALALSEIV